MSRPSAAYLKFRGWLDGLDVKAYSGITLAAVCIIAMAVFDVMPDHNLLVVNAFISGCIWSFCVFVLIAGGKRVDALLFAAFSLIAGGLTTSIPSIFHEHTPVDWGSTLSRLGFLLLVIWVGLSIFSKAKEQHGDA
jgi:hypothetical protein